MLDVLLVDDDPALVQALTAGFDPAEFEVRAALTGTAGIDAIDDRDPDVIILDLGLPDIDGLDVCRHLRARTSTPIIVLSADGAESRKVAALDLGADDYLTKPFSLPELLARIRVARRHAAAAAGTVTDEVLRVGSVEIDDAAHEVRVHGRPTALSPKEYALLLVLARNQDLVLTYRRLVDHVWEPGHSMHSLRTHVSALRSKLRALDADVAIRIEPGVGYRLTTADPGDGE